MTFSYELPAGAAAGKLLLRESVSGRVVLRESLGGQVVLRREVVTGESAVTLSVAALPPGLYLGMLVVGGHSISSVRLQITR